MKSEIIPIENIQNKIYDIRGLKVMLDSDLAKLYEVETRVLNQAVKRNIKRFPSDFMFQLTREEIMNISQIVITSKIKHSPKVFAFTEQGIAMLSGILNRDSAIYVNISIMRAFIKLRKIILDNSDLQKQINLIFKRLDTTDTDVKKIFNIIQFLLSENEKIQPVVSKNKRPMGFNARI